MTRLDAVCSLIVPADIIADVGCDHGKVARYCARSGMFESVIASDISDECLKKAKIALGGFDKVKFVCCDGIKFYCDEAVIAGMGGLNISDILANAETLPKVLIVCPHRDAEALRRTLVKLGYVIEKDIAVEERGKVYFVMRAELKDKPQALTELQYKFGTDYDKHSEELLHYLIKLYNTYKIAPEKNVEKLRYVREALSAQGLEKYL